MKSKEVGLRIKNTLRENNLSQVSVAKDIGIPQSVISDIINGRRDYDKLVNMLSERYGWSRDYLITGEQLPKGDFIANSDIDGLLSAEEHQKLIENLQKLYSKHDELLMQAGQVMKQIVAINKILIIGVE